MTGFRVGEELVTFPLPVNDVKCLLVINFAHVFNGLMKLQLAVSFRVRSAGASLMLRGWT